MPVADLGGGGVQGSCSTCSAKAAVLRGDGKLRRVLDNQLDCTRGCGLCPCGCKLESGIKLRHCLPILHSGMLSNPRDVSPALVAFVLGPLRDREKGDHSMSPGNDCLAENFQAVFWMVSCLSLLWSTRELVKGVVVSLCHMDLHEYIPLSVPHQSQHTGC